MKARRPKSRRRGVFAFALPIVVVGVIVAIALLNPATTQGTLVIEASADYGSGQSTPLHVTAFLNGQRVVTPTNSSLTQGTYTVSYQSLQWFTTPANHTVVLEGGKTAYSVGVYYPIARVIGVSRAGFNASAVSALHAVTPVEWVNTGTTYLQINLQTSGTVGLAPGQTFTTTFTVPGTYAFSLEGTNVNGTVAVR